MRQVNGRIVDHLLATPQMGYRELRAAFPGGCAYYSLMYVTGLPEVGSMKNSTAPCPWGWSTGTFPTLPWEFPKIHPLRFLAPWSWSTTHNMAIDPANNAPFKSWYRGRGRSISKSVLLFDSFWQLITFRLRVKCWASMHLVPSSVTTWTHFNIKEV